MNEKFKSDLDMGKAYEALALSVLQKEGYSLIANPNEKGIDLLEISWGFEVKVDLYNFRNNITNGNVYIEYESYGKPSGIFKEEAYPLKKWIQVLPPNDILILDGRRFRRFVAERIDECIQNKSLTSKWCRLATWWDWNMTKWLLIPVAEIKKHAERNLSFSTEALSTN